MNKEKEFISIINKILNKTSMDNILIGIGDDAAITTKNIDNNLVICSDSIVEGVHFSKKYYEFEDIGWKSLSVNISDLASMGAIPNYYTVSIGAPKNLSNDNFTKLIEGMKNCCDTYGGSIVGGDIVLSNQLFISVSATGRLISQKYMTRDAAKEGEKIAVTGNLGDSLGGFNLLKNNFDNEYLTNKHLRPTPKINQSKDLVLSGVNCCMDISDGLHNDLLNLSKKSNVGIHVDVEKIPISEDLIKEFPNTFLDIAINGGEDYELLFTFDETKIELPFEYYVIGTVIKKNSVEISYKKNNKEYYPNLDAWSHFE